MSDPTERQRQQASAIDVAALNAAVRGILDFAGSAVLFESSADWLEGPSLHTQRDKPTRMLRVTHGLAASWNGQPDPHLGAGLAPHVCALVDAGVSVGVPAAADALLPSPTVLPAGYRRDQVAFPASAALPAGAAYVFYSRVSPKQIIPPPWENELVPSHEIK
jgi:hypothetical protein